MKRFIEGSHRGQATLLPECLDDWIDESNPVRAIDALCHVSEQSLRWHSAVPTFAWRSKVLQQNALTQMLCFRESHKRLLECQLQ
jgi:hypothetical protein